MTSNNRVNDSSPFFSPDMTRRIGGGSASRSATRGRTGEDILTNTARSSNIHHNQQQQNAPFRSPEPSPALLPTSLPSSSRLHHIPEDSNHVYHGINDGSGTVSPFGEAPHRYNHSGFSYGPLRASTTLRHVQRVSKRAALVSKKVIWDSNDNAIDAAQSAVDQWEDAYNALRGLLVVAAQSAVKLYGAAKAGATGLEHGILVPVRDWILLPAFDAAENTIGFLQSDQANQLASQSLQLAHQVPWIGASVLAPGMVLSVQILQTTWQFVLYPIPSRQDVRQSVDFVLTGTKWALTTTVREVLLYMKRADAIITRTLSHTQWKVLGSGPYATLDKLNKQEVIDHLCERYFSIRSTVARYELAAHIRTHNLPLYLDLVLTGLLRERGRDLTKDDEWLSSCPSYRKNSKAPFLLPNYFYVDSSSSQQELPQSPDAGLSDKESALWFRLPYINGRRPGRDTPWLRFNGGDRAKLEQRYLEVYKEGKCQTAQQKQNDGSGCGSFTRKGILENGLERPATAFEDQQQQQPQQDPDAHQEFSSCQSNDEGRGSCNVDEYGDKEDDPGNMNVTSGYPTIASWYVPDRKDDVLVDQKRYSVSYRQCCPRCREQMPPRPTHPSQPAVCQNCAANSQAAVTNHWMASSILSPPPLCMVMRPNLWRFHGPGDEVRRAVWFLDTRKHGLQPYDDEAQAVLEDAYLFLKWRNEHLKEGLSQTKNDTARKPILENTCPENGEGSTRGDEEEDEDLNENSLLTVQVSSPDGGEQQLVQFSSLTAATAIKKGLGGAISLFKRRVYRGADLSHPKLPESSNGVSAEAVFADDVNLKCAPPSQKEENMIADANREEMEEDEGDWTMLPPPSGDETLAVPASQFDDIDRDPLESLGDNEDQDDIDHLVLIVHGIGEMLQSVDLFGLGSIVDCCGYLRKNHAEVQSARFSQMYPTSEATSPASTGRVEYLPIEWHEAFSIMSQRMSPQSKSRKSASTGKGGQLVRGGSRSSQVMMKDISLRTIPQMRSFANDTLFDVLYFMSTEHHDVIVDIVSNEMNVVVQKFRALTGFEGRVSVIGHSLGSIITWDILANQTPSRGMESFDDPVPAQQDVVGDWESISALEQINNSLAPGDLSPMTEPNQFLGGDLNRSSFDEEEEHLNANSSPEDALIRHPTQPFQYPKLNFDVENFFALGSPIAVFLMVRNQTKPLSTDYTLKGCSRVYNIFHPYDPVAYRIEPLLDPRNAEFEPRIMTHWNGGFRVQYQTKRLWRKLIQTTMQTQQTVIERLEAGIAGMGLLDSTVDLQDDDNQSQPSNAVYEDDQTGNSITAGKLNQGRRIDYMLQEKEIEAANEYVAALAAHSCYWQEKDLSLFVARQIYLSRQAYEQALHFEDLLPLESSHLEQQ